VPRLLGVLAVRGFALRRLRAGVGEQRRSGLRSEHVLVRIEQLVGDLSGRIEGAELLVRRVESFRFTGVETVRRQMSIDFELPTEEDPSGAIDSLKVETRRLNKAPNRHSYPVRS
jgi:hypothetical protein